MLAEIMCVLLAQDSGSMAGWMTAISTVGLLGPVLYWLCYVHLPSKDKQIKDLITDKDSQLIVKDARLETMVTQFLNEVKQARQDFAVILGKEREQRHEERNQVHTDNLKMALVLSELSITAVSHTQETRALAQETRALAGSVGNLIEQEENKS